MSHNPNTSGAVVPSAAPQTIICDECHKVTPLVVKEMPIGHGLWEGVVACQSCQFLYHAYFINTVLRIKRKRLMKLAQGGNISAYQSRKAEYKILYDALQLAMPTEFQKTVGEKAVYTGNDKAQNNG